MSLTRKIRTLTFGLGITGAALIGCGLIQVNQPTQKQVATRSNPTIEDAMKALGVTKKSMVIELSDGYKTIESALYLLKRLAGVYAETIKLRKVSDGYVLEGSYDEYQNPEALMRALTEADSDANKIITHEEAKAAFKRITSQYAK